MIEASSFLRLPMSKNPSSNKAPQFGPRFLFVVTSILFFGPVIVLCCVVGGNVGFPIAVSAVFMLLGIRVLMQDDDKIQQEKRSRRMNRRQQAIEKEKANFEAQLRKPDFKTRLHSFTQTDRKNEEDVPESQMEFWERSEEYFRTPTRPVELIRSLLQQISKLVGMR